LIHRGNSCRHTEIVMEVNQRTVTQLTRELGIDRFRLERILSRCGIEPVARVGNARLYDTEAVGRIRDELARLDARRQGGAA